MWRVSSEVLESMDIPIGTLDTSGSVVQCLILGYIFFIYATNSVTEGL